MILNKLLCYSVKQGTMVWKTSASCWSSCGSVASPHSDHIPILDPNTGECAAEPHLALVSPRREITLMIFSDDVVAQAQFRCSLSSITEWS